MQNRELDLYETRKTKVNATRRNLLIMVDIEVGQFRKTKPLFNSISCKQKKKEEFIVVMEEEVYDSSLNQSELQAYSSNRSSGNKISISPQPSSKSDNSCGPTSRNHIEEKEKSSSKFRVVDQNRPVILEAPNLKKKTLLLSENKKEANVYEAYKLLKNLANKLKIQLSKSAKSPEPNRGYYTAREDLLNIPSPLILNKKSSNNSVEDHGFSLHNEMNTREEILKVFEKRSINILKEKNLNKKKSYSIYDIINHIENNKDNSITSNTHSSNSTSFFEDKNYTSEGYLYNANVAQNKNQTVNLFRSPEKLNTFEGYKSNINKSASKHEMQYSGNINLSPIEKSCIKLHKCDLERPTKSKDPKKGFTITLKKC